VPDAEDAEEQGQPKAAPRIGYLVDGGGELGEMGGATGRSAAGETQGEGGGATEDLAPGRDRRRALSSGRRGLPFQDFFRYVLSFSA
jgi:hypothetical protein